MHEGKEEAPVFRLKPLSDGVMDSVTDLMTAEKKASALRKAALHAVKGWSNLEPEFTDSGPLKGLPNEWVYELGGKAIEISSLTESEKN